MKRKQKTASPCITSPLQPSHFAVAKAKIEETLFTDRLIIEDQAANNAGTSLDLEGCLNLCASAHVKMKPNDKKILAQFKKDHLGYLNLGAHGIVIPNPDRVAAARDCIDQFIKNHV